MTHPLDDTHDSGHPEPSLPLPIQDSDSKHTAKKFEEAKNPAADLIRQKVNAIYAHEPNAAEEALDIAELGPKSHHSKHQQYISELTNSGKSLAEIQVNWHDYYAGLNDKQKHEVWQEFYSAHAQASKLAAVVPNLSSKHAPRSHRGSPRAPKPTTDLKDYMLNNVATRRKLKPAQQLQSLLFGLGVGCLVLLIVLFGFFNERFIAPFIQPSRTISNTPIISDSSVTPGPNPEVIIPKINVEIPVVYGINTIDDNAVENALEDGVVHYADTAVPGQNGNVVVVGHSSNNIFNKGKYKFAFVLLSRLENGDTFYLQKDSKRYTYQVYEKKIVSPIDVSVLLPTTKPATATLITCDPPGTSINRLVVIAEQISPDPIANAPPATDTALATESKTIPGNAPSLWSRIVNLL